MRLVSLLNNPKPTWAVIGFFCGIAVSWFSQPLYKYFLITLYEQEFSALTFQCDQAMREHWIGKMKLANQPSAEAVNTLKASEIALLDCNSYDLLQKKLKRLGLTEAEIGEMVLRSSESDPTGLQTIIGIHEIRH